MAVIQSAPGRTFSVQIKDNSLLAKVNGHTINVCRRRERPDTAACVLDTGGEVLTMRERAEILGTFNRCAIPLCNDHYRRDMIGR